MYVPEFDARSLKHLSKTKNDARTTTYNMHGPGSQVVWKGTSNPANGHQSKPDVVNAQTWPSTSTCSQLLLRCERGEQWPDHYDSNIRPPLNRSSAIIILYNHQQRLIASYDHRGHKIWHRRSSCLGQSNVHQDGC